MADYGVVWKDIGYLPEENPLYGDMLVAESLGHLAELTGFQRDVPDRNVGRVVRRTGLGQVRWQPISALRRWLSPESELVYCR